MTPLKRMIIGTALTLFSIGGLLVNPLHEQTAFNAVSDRLAAGSAGGAIVALIAGLLFLVNSKKFNLYATAWVIVGAGTLFWLARFFTTGSTVLDAGFRAYWAMPPYIVVFTIAPVIFSLILIDRSIQKRMSLPEKTGSEHRPG